jgi:hypothetical protein
MNPNVLQQLPVLGTDEIRAILVKRIDQQKQAYSLDEAAHGDWP